jgi:glutathione S-transferase
MASNQEEVKLFGMLASPFVSRVEIALKLKGIEYKYEEEKWGNLSDTLFKYNPVYKKVPVLVHNDKPISESLVIVEYIDETWKQNPILPSDSYKRALVRFWSNFIDDKVNYFPLLFMYIIKIQYLKKYHNHKVNSSVYFLFNVY